MIITPLNSRVVVQRDEAPKQTAEGVFLPGGTPDPNTWTVLSSTAGPEHPLAEGARVFMLAHSGVPIDVPGHTPRCRIVKMEDILGIIP